MQALRWTLKAGGFALACAFLAAAISPPAARAQAQVEEEEEDNLPDAQLFRDAMIALGLRPSRNAGIDYRERSPLVVPPSFTLPPPEQPVAARNPQWPVDQDVRRQRQAAAARRARGRTFDEVIDTQPLSREELTPGRGRAPAGSVSGPREQPAYTGTPETPSALGYVGGIFDTLFARDKPEYKAFTGEPPRTALVEPPEGYRTPSPAQPYGVGKSKELPELYKPEEGIR